jgi:DNA mismatch endonuclease (patch repair protein)
MDKVSQEKRSEIMSHIRSKNTMPEIVVRKIVFYNGYRYRLYKKDLPGKPDLVFVKLRKVIFVNGCFWHGHNCRKNLMPKNNQVYWKTKIEENVKRDKKNHRKLNRLGWSYCNIWECEIRNKIELEKKILTFLEKRKRLTHAST